MRADIHYAILAAIDFNIWKEEQEISSPTDNQIEAFHGYMPRLRNPQGGCVVCWSIYKYPKQQSFTHACTIDSTACEDCPLSTSFSNYKKLQGACGAYCFSTEDSKDVIKFLKILRKSAMNIKSSLFPKEETQ